MSEDLKNHENNFSIKTNRFAESKGTGIFSSLIFMTIVFVLMIVITHFIK